MGATVHDIGYAFLQTYYHRMSKDPSKVSCLYSATAELTHTNYQVDFSEGSDILPTVKLTGKENISKFFTRNNKKVSDLKVMVETCDFQTTGTSHASILILTTGEMFWTATPTYKFCQTIILTPSGTKDTFDVTNDAIRFISDDIGPRKQQDDSLKEKQFVGKQAKNEQQEPQEQKVKQELLLERDMREKKEQASQEEIEFKAVVENIKEDPKQGLSKPESKEDIKEEVKKEVEEGPKQNFKEPSQDATPPQQAHPPVRISWASKLAANNDSHKTTNDPQYNGTRKVVDCKPEMSNRKEINNRTAKKKPLFSTVNKDGYYPIYIKGTAGLKEDRLKSALEAEFGTIMKITNADSFAVVDFQTQKSQIDALEKRQLTIDDAEIVMGRKTVKKSPSPPVGGTQAPLRSHKKHSGKKRD